MKITQNELYDGVVRHVQPLSPRNGPVKKVYVSIALDRRDPSHMVVKVYWNTRSKGPAPEVGVQVRVRFEVNSRSGISCWVIPREEYISPGGNPCSEIVLKEEGVCVMSTNTMSHDRVRLFISSGYFNTQPQRGCLRDVLKKAFDMDEGEILRYMASEGYGGFYIVCRPSQFARFLIFRNAAGIKNGFIDLQATLYVPEPKQSPFDALAESAGVNICAVMKVIDTLGLGRNDVEAAMADGKNTCGGPPEIDVSRNKYAPR